MTSIRFLSILDGAIQEYSAKTFAQRMLIYIYLCTMQCIPICSTLTDNKSGGGNVLVEIVGYSSQLLAPGTFRGTKCVVPFSLPLKSKGDTLLLETYHGVRVKIVYNIKAGLKRKSRLQQIQLITGHFSVFSKHASNQK